MITVAKYIVTLSKLGRYGAVIFTAGKMVLRDVPLSDAVRMQLLWQLFLVIIVLMIVELVMETWIWLKKP